MGILDKSRFEEAVDKLLWRTSRSIRVSSSGLRKIDKYKLIYPQQYRDALMESVDKGAMSFSEGFFSLEHPCFSDYYPNFYLDRKPLGFIYKTDCERYAKGLFSGKYKHLRKLIDKLIIEK